ncbi:MAG TPA: hypothetical protein VG842_03845 [Sediminibacterium sp.]|nr:hypothetical protein [Sediminibacterium sp.]
MQDQTTQSTRTIQIVECPRDAMQGWPYLIPTDQKIRYLNALLQVGFHTLDFGSFVSAKVIPQMADSLEVLAQLDIAHSHTKLLAIVANLRGAQTAATQEKITCIGYPFSVSPTFQLRNTHASQEAALSLIDEMQELCLQHGKELVVYLSMGFGNPYGDPYNIDMLLHWTDIMAAKGISIISLADTVGLAKPGDIRTALQALIPSYPEMTIGVHLHAAPDQWQDKLRAAFQAGCRRFDGAIGGIGGCPMAQDALVGNLDTLHLLDFLGAEGSTPGIDTRALAVCRQLAMEIFH